MPRLTVQVPKYRLHKASGQAVVSLNGQVLYLGRYGSPQSKANYNQLVAEWQLNGRQSLAAAQVTIDELILAYCEFAGTYYVKNGRPTSEQSTVRAALRPLHAFYGQTLASNFTPSMLRAVRHDMITSLHWCRSHINKQVSRIKSMFRWAVEHELIDASTHHALVSVRGLRKDRSDARESEPVKPAPEPYIEAVLPYVSRQVAAMIQLQLLTGMRPGEVIAMRTCDLDTSGPIWSYTPESHKTEHHGKARVIYLGPRAQEIIKPFLKKELTAGLFSPADAEEERHHKCRSRRKTPMTPSQRRRKRTLDPLRGPCNCYSRDSYRRAIERGCDRAFPVPKGQMPDDTVEWRREHRWHPNQLRHNAATRLRKEFGIEAARVVLGHSSAAITEVYAELDSMKAAEVMARVG